MRNHVRDRARCRRLPGNSQEFVNRDQTTSEARIKHTIVRDQGRISCQCLREIEIRSDEFPTLGARKQSPGRCIAQVLVSNNLLSAECEVVDGSQQRAIVKDS